MTGWRAHLEEIREVEPHFVSGFALTLFVFALFPLIAAALP